MHNVIGKVMVGLVMAVSLSSSVLASDSVGVKPPVELASAVQVTADLVKPTVAPVSKPVTLVGKTAPKEPRTYEVQSGDSLSTIAAAEQLEGWRQLWNVNPELTDPNLIYAGEKLVVPEGPTTDRPLPAGVAPLPEPAQSVSSQTHGGGVARANYAAGAPGLLERIRMRESGGNYAINTGNGYYGAYQFSLSAWQGVGGTGLPSEASPAEQDMRAQMLLDRRGCSPWPNTCY